MNILRIGERRVFYMEVDVDGSGRPSEVPIDETTYKTLSLLHNNHFPTDGMKRPPNYDPPPAATEQRTSMADLMEQLDHADTPPQPLEETPADLQEKLKSLGFGSEEPDPGELLASASDEAGGDQL